MRIMVYDVAAESGGATSILEYFYEQHKLDKNNHYYYMLSVYHLNNTENITVINVPKVKNGWLNRLIFDYYGVKKYIKKYCIDEVLSLQNTIVPCFKGKQTVYEHNALPFSEYRFSYKEDREMWVYQNVIGRFMIRSIKRASHVIVQTEWMRKAILNKVPKAVDKIEVKFPEIQILDGFKYTPQKEKVFFYPANSSKFKNHRLVVKACEIIKKKTPAKYTIVFTLNGNETEGIKELYKISANEQLNIKWIGQISRKEVFEWYEKSVLIFPSYIETVGLPIYEAIAIGSPVLLANCQYARDVARDYKNAFYFDYNDENTLANHMMTFLDE